MSTPLAGLRSGRLGPELWNNLRVGVLTGSIGGWVLGILMAAATLALNPVLLRSAGDVTLLLLGFVLVNGVFCLALGVLGALGKTAIFAWTGRELSDTKMAAFVTGLVFFLITGLYGWTWCRWHGIGGLTPNAWPGLQQIPVLLLIAGVAVLLARLMTYALYLLIVHFKKPERRRPGEVRKAFLILVYMGSAFAFFLAILRLTAAPVRPDAGLSQGARDPSGAAVALLAIDGMSEADLTELRRAGQADGTTAGWTEPFVDGAWLPLESDPALVPPVAWTQVATGRAVAAHGIFDYQTQVVRGLGTPLAVGPSQIGVFDLFRTVLPMFRMTRPVPMRSYMRGAKGLWNMTTDAGLRAAVVNWWVSWPAERIIGSVVTDHAFLRLSQPTNWSSLPPDRETFPNSRLLELAPLANADTDSVLDPDALARALAVFERERIPRDVLLSDLFALRAAAALGRAEHPDLWLCHLPGPDILRRLLRRDIDDPERRARTLAELTAAYWRALDPWIVSALAASSAPRHLLICLPGQPWAEEDARRGLIAAAIAPGDSLPRNDATPERSVTERSAAVARLTDITPTTLWLLGLPTSAEMDGAPRRELWPAGPDPRTIASYGFQRPPDATEARGLLDSEMLERFRSLGYLQ